MKVVAAMTAIVIHATLYRDLAMKESHVALAKCVVVHQQRKQQNELSGSGDNQITDENITDATTTTLCYNCDHEHLRQHYEDRYQIIATLNVEDKEVLANSVDVQKQWQKVIIEAMEVQRAKHYQRLYHKPAVEDNYNRSVDVQMLETECSSRACAQKFVVLYNDDPIPAEIVLSDLSLLSLPRISARLGIPVESLKTSLSVGNEKSQWWIIALVIGIAASIIAAGWLCLFVYYNSCGRPYNNTTVKKSIIFLKDKFIQTTENGNEGKDFDDQLRDHESNKSKSVKREFARNDPGCRVEKAVKDDSIRDVVPEITTVAASRSISKQSVHTNQQQFDHPISIITRPRRRDSQIQKSEFRSDLSVPTLKEICAEEKLHPRPIPPTASGILEVRSLAEQLYRNPMNCL